MALFQEHQYRFGRPADRSARARYDDRPLQQDGVLGDRPGDVALGEIGLLLAELLELSLAIANQLPGLAAQQSDQLLDLGLAGRLPEILAHVGVYSLLAQKLQRLPRLAATWIVPNDDGHATSCESITLRARS